MDGSLRAGHVESWAMTGRALKAMEFAGYCEEVALRELPEGFPRLERKVMWTILQLHFGDPHVHFELQPMPSRGIIELGLHFEGPPEANEAWAARVSERAPEIMAGLGPSWELEEWTASWRRLHRTFPMQELTETLGNEVAAELRRLLMLLQPIVCQPVFAASNAH